MSRHPALWGDMAAVTPRLLIATNGLRLFTGALAVAIVLRWGLSMWRCLRCRPLDDDPDKAVWVPLAIAVLIFEARWFLPKLGVVTLARMALAAHCSMATALMFAIYVHGAQRSALRLRRALLVYLAMLTICVAASVIVR